MARKNYVPAQRYCCIFGPVFAILCLLAYILPDTVRKPTNKTNYSVLYNYRDSVLSIIISALSKSQYHQTERKCPAKLLHMY